MEYKITDIIEAQFKDEYGIEINIGIEAKGLCTDVCSIRIKAKTDHFDKITPGLETLIKKHIKKVNELTQNL